MSQSDTFFPKLKNTIVKIDIKSFSVYCKNNAYFYIKEFENLSVEKKRLSTALGFEPIIDVFGNIKN